MPYPCVDTFIALYDPYVVEKIKRRKMSRSTALTRRVIAPEEDDMEESQALTIPDRSEIEELVNANRELEAQMADMVEQMRVITEANQQLRVRNESLLTQLQNSSSASEGSVSSRGSYSTPAVYEDTGKTVRVRGIGVVPISRRSDTGTYWTIRSDGIPRKLTVTQAACAQPTPIVLTRFL